MIVLLAGFLVRLAVLSATRDLRPKIADEMQYVQLAAASCVATAWPGGRTGRRRFGRRSIQR